MRTLVLSAALVLTLALFVACSDDDEAVVPEGGTTLPATSTGAAASTSHPVTSAPAAGGTSREPIELVAADFQFGPTVLTFDGPGTVQVHFTNTGQAKHSFTIDALDVSEDIDPNTDHTFDFEVPDHTVEFHCRFHPTP